jgi:SAM-dependent methyltransferase
MRLAQEFCLGRGIEIGAASYSDFGVDAWNLDLTAKPLPAYRDEQLRHAGRLAPIHIVGLGETLPIRSNSQDFLLASHVLEHSPNPIGTLIEWDRVIRPGGVLFLIVPHKERTPDRVRPRTPLAHVVEDFHTNRTPMTHRETNGFLTPPALHMPHYHAWITVDLLEVVAWMIEQRLVSWYLEEIEDIDSDRHNGFTFVLRKQAESQPRDSADSWVSRRALRSMLRCPDQLAFLKSRGLIADGDLLEVVAGTIIWQDILIQDCTRIIKSHEWEIGELQRDLNGVRVWAQDLEARLLALSGKAVSVPAIDRLRSRLTQRRRRKTGERAAPLEAAPAQAAVDQQASATPPALDEAHFDRLVAEREPRLYQASQRWGSREVEIVSVELFGGQEEVMLDIHSGEPVIVRMRYLAHQPVENPVFGVAIHTPGGIQVLGLNTAFSNIIVPRIEGHGVAVCSFDALSLLAGRYSLSCAIYDAQLAHAYDHQYCALTFGVIGARSADHYGLVTLPHRWAIQPAAEAAEEIGVEA